MKRTEEFKTGDFITNDLKNGVTWKVVEIKPNRNGILLQRADALREKAHVFLSNADTTRYFKLDKISGEFDVMFLKYIPINDQDN